LPTPSDQAAPATRCRRLRAGSTLAALLTCQAAAAVEKVDVGAPASLVAGEPALLAESPEARGDGVLRAALVFDYTRAPLVLVSDDQTAERVVEGQLWLHALASFSVAHRWLIALEVPALLRQAGDEQPPWPELSPVSSTTALGDPRLTLRARVLGRPDDVALGVGVRASAPLASTDYAGDPGPTLRPFVSLGQRSEAGFSAINLGFEWRKAQALPGVVPTRIGSSLTFSAAAGYALDSARSTRLGPELALVTTVGNGARALDPRSTVCQLLLHLQHRIRGGPFEVGVAFGPTLGRAPGAADYRALLSLMFSPEEPVPPPDSDGDRVPDDNDMCPSLPGEAAEDPMMHGCPAIPSDADGDGIPDTLDACPRTPGATSVVRQRHGCPKPQDRDHDSIADPDDACPDQPGLESTQREQRGCPAPAPPKVTLEREQITISEQVQFETGTARIRDESSTLLEQVAAVLQAHPEIERCEVAGHTDDTGTTELNRELSEARARAVVSWLTGHGVDGRRLSARGYGQTRPLTDNDSEAGRARNRRVEFLILRRAAGKPGEEQP
jgi:OmpA-OmpF porin, OOP family